MEGEANDNNCRWKKKKNSFKNTLNEMQKEEIAQCDELTTLDYFKLFGLMI